MDIVQITVVIESLTWCSQYIGLTDGGFNHRHRPGLKTRYDPCIM